MACVLSAYKASLKSPPENRDDLALLMVAERLPVLLSGRVENPVVDDQYLDEGWSPEHRRIFVAEAQALHARLREAIQGTDSTERALASLASAFGDRIPDDHALIKDEGSGQIGAPAVLMSGLVKQMGSEQAPQEAVKREGDRRYG